MSELNGSNDGDKKSRVTRQQKQMPVLTPTFTIGQLSASGAVWDRSLQGSGFLQRQCACGLHTIAGGECPTCRQKREPALLQRSVAPGGLNNALLNNPAAPDVFPELRTAQDLSQIPAHTSASRPMIQTKLALGPIDDRYEQEADQVAKEVVGQINSPRQPVQRARAPQEDDLMTKPLIQLQPEAGPTLVNPDVETAIQQARGNGQPLADPMRLPMEQAFGADFSRVKIHTDPQSHALNRSLQARAFTTGQDIFFRHGEYNPGSSRGQELLAHELTHVVQQNGLQRQHQATAQRSSTPAHQAGRVTPNDAPDTTTIRRVAWYPNTDTNTDRRPWGSGPNGDVLEAATDAGASVKIWRPHDNTTYWCHGYTFGGSTARGGPYSIWGQSVPTVLADDGWSRVSACLAAPGDILVFYTKGGLVAHTGIIRSVSAPNGRIDESASTLESKWGQRPLNTSSWSNNIAVYKKYRAFSKNPAQGPCNGDGANELP